MKLLYFAHIIRKLDGKTIMLGKVEDRRKRGGPNITGIDSIKEATL